MSSSERGAESLSLYRVILSTVWRKSPGDRDCARSFRTSITVPVGRGNPASRSAVSISWRVGGLSKIAAAKAFLWPSNAFSVLDVFLRFPAVTMICASPSCHWFSASMIVSSTKLLASSTKATRGPGKKPMALTASSNRALSLRNSLAGMRVRRISSSPWGPTRAAITS